MRRPCRRLRDDVALLQAGFGRAGAFADGRHVAPSSTDRPLALGVLRVHGGEGHAELRMGRVLPSMICWARFTA